MRGYNLSRAAAIAAACGLLLVGVRPAVAGPRQRERIDANWQFQQEESPSNPFQMNGAAVNRWTWKADEGDAAVVAPPTPTGPGWSPMRIGADLFGNRPGFAWCVANLTEAAAKTKGAPTSIQFGGVDDNATVYLNGVKIGQHSGWNEPFALPVGSAWKTDGPNFLAVRVENQAGAGGIVGAVQLIGRTAVASGQPAQTAPGFDDRSWRRVHLPHDFVVEGVFTPTADTSHGSLPFGTGWYRKSFVLPAASKGKSVWVEFDGIYRDGAVWLNGHFLGRHPGGYTPVRFNLAPFANFGGRNVLAVHVDARLTEGWWYEGGGIYRHVWLNTAAPIHVAPNGVFLTSDVKDEAGPKPVATLNADTTLTNESASSQSVVLTTRIQDPAGRMIETLHSTARVPAGGTVRVAQKSRPLSALLWSIEQPRLYRIATVVEISGKPIDQVDTPFGFRTIRFDADKGFFLNGKSVKLQGTCNHQDFAGVGVAMPDSVLVYRIKRLKEMGSNAYRCSHNPVAAELLDACDRLGMLVMDENRHLGDTYAQKSSPTTPASDLGDLKEMVTRDRNHPSVIMWSICNEEGIQGSPAGARIGLAMKKVVNELDPTRLVTAAMNGGHGQGLSTILDLEGVNYSPGYYDQYHRTHPDHPVYGSETASTVSTRGIYANDKVRGYVSAYDVNFPGWAQTAEDAWQPIAERPFVAGGFAWTGFDYKGEPTPYGWPCINSHFGIMDECGFAKDNFYYYQAWWTDKPDVHLLPHWNWAGEEGKPISVWALSSAERIELLVNGVSAGTKEMPRYRHVEWSIPYAPGRLEARAYQGDKLVATDVVETTGPPAALRLKANALEFPADGEEVAMVAVEVVDDHGRVVPTADNMVTFATSGVGSVVGVGNGDPSSHEPDKAKTRSAFNGLCMAIVGAAEQRGTLRLTATSPGLKSAELTLRAR